MSDRLTNISTTHHWMEETDRPTIYIFYEKPFEDRQEPNPIVTNDSQWWHWPCSSRHVTHVGKERHSGPFFLLISGASFFRFAADPSIIQDLCTTAEGSFSLSLFVPLHCRLLVCMYLALIYVFNGCIEFRYPKFSSFASTRERVDLFVYTSTLELSSFFFNFIDLISFWFSELNNSIKYLVNKSFKKTKSKPINLKHIRCRVQVEPPAHQSPLLPCPN